MVLTGPLFVTLGAIFFLGEKVRARRWIALGAGVVGTLIIIRPGVEEVSTDPPNRCRGSALSIRARIQLP